MDTLVTGSDLVLSAVLFDVVVDALGDVVLFPHNPFNVLILLRHNLPTIIITSFLRFSQCLNNSQGVIPG